MRDVLSNRKSYLQKLPEVCAARMPGSGQAVMISRGVSGYSPVPWPHFDPDAFNRAAGVTPAQREAMLAGSMFGWHVPAADPDNPTNQRAQAEA